MSDEVERHSKPLEVELITDPDQLARQEARNGLRQFDLVMEMVEYWLQPDRPFRLRMSAILQLNRVALEGISAFAGVPRPSSIEISGSLHAPPGAHLVPEFLEQMCDYVNEHWMTATPLHLAAFAMWRMNWIHPFVDGNGRTARALSYLVLCVRLGYRLPGVKTIPEQIAASKDTKQPYYKALEAADKSKFPPTADVSALEALLGDLLARQLASVLDAAGAASFPAALTDRAGQT